MPVPGGAKPPDAPIHLHESVLVSEVLSLLASRLDGIVIDATAGAGGHAEAMLEASSNVSVVAYDRDPVAVEAAKVRLHRFGSSRARVRLANFRNITEEYAKEKLDPPSAILMDLGLSDMQIHDPNRGFSFMRMGPLSMRMGPDAVHSADEFVAHLSERELADLIHEYGEDNEARRIARRIVEARERGGIGTTTQLAEIISGPNWKGFGPHRIHPATKTFQALRIRVNEEMEALESVLPQAVAMLRPGGRLAVISFHSLEDRPVKQFMATGAKSCLCPPDFPVCRCGHKQSLQILTKKPVTASEDEIRRNPSSRSAKLRVAEKL